MRLGLGSALIGVCLFATIPAQAASPDATGCEFEAVPSHRIEYCTRVIQSDRYSGAEAAWIYRNRGSAYLIERHYDQAIAQDRKTLELDPNFVYTSWVIAQSYEQTGRYQESVAELNRARTIDANWPYIIAELGYAYAALGERSEAEKILQQLKERAAREYIDAILIAYIHVGLGQKDQAFAWLEKAYQERSGLMPWLKGEPKWDPLRGDARFADLLRRIGIAH